MSVSPKEKLKEVYKIQASRTADAISDLMCQQLSELATGKQMLEIQKIFKANIKVDTILEMMVDFIVEDAKLSASDIEFVTNYMQTDVAQRVIKSGINLQLYLLSQQEEFGKMAMTPEIIAKLEEIIG